MDQANKLRQLINQKQAMGKVEDRDVKIYSIVSGKGGVGKTNFAINLAIKLQQMGKKVLILDADIGMSNANILLGIEVLQGLYHAIEDNVPIKDLIVKGPQGVDLISGGSDLFYLENLDPKKQQEIVDDLCTAGDYDILIIDNGAGISKQSLAFTILADEIILVTTPEPTAITDAYRVLKAISTYKLKNRVKVVINQVHDLKNGDEAFNKLMNTSKQFLQIELENLGYIFNDIRVIKAIMDQYPVVLKEPNSLASNNISQICTSILQDKEYVNNISSLAQLKNRLIKLFG